MLFSLDRLVLHRVCLVLSRWSNDQNLSRNRRGLFEKLHCVKICSETRTSDNIFDNGLPQQLSRSLMNFKSLQGHFDFFLAPRSPLCIDSFILTHLCSLSVALLFQEYSRGSKDMGSPFFSFIPFDES